MKKPNKLLKYVSAGTTGVLALLMLTLLYSVIVPRIIGGEPNIIGYQLKTVLSGSMEPEIKTGSIIAIKPITQKTVFQENDVITFISPDDHSILITHRIIAVKGEGTHFLTKGDNNDNPDSQPVLAQNIVGKYEGFTIPYVGYLVNFGKSKLGSILFLIIPGIIILGYSIVTLWKAISSLEDKKKEETA
ncbi:signal peptidase I [Bacillus sp. JJ1533]|uniref:signal peptidase I SipW n=1 Tax=Bacillus sp. JJ1533 TaxID=3122959 RepID=UPI002FFF5F78